MDEETDQLAQRFEENRPHLRAVAYRMLGSAAEAEDAVQESWLRVSRAGTDDVTNLGGWLTTIVAHVCLDMLRSRKSRREEPLGVEVPEPAAGPAGGFDPEREALLADAVGPALLVVLEMLAPAERLAFVLHDMFAVPFDEIAPIVGRTPGGGAPAREPGAAARAGDVRGPRGRARPEAGGRRRVPRRVARRRLRRAARATGSRRRVAGRRGRAPVGSGGRGPRRGARRPPRVPGPARVRRSRWSTAPRGSSWRPTGSCPSCSSS